MSEYINYDYCNRVFLLNSFANHASYPDALNVLSRVPFSTEPTQDNSYVAFSPPPVMISPAFTSPRPQRHLHNSTKTPTPIPFHKSIPITNVSKS